MVILGEGAYRVQERANAELTAARDEARAALQARSRSDDEQLLAELAPLANAIDNFQQERRAGREQAPADQVHQYVLETYGIFTDRFGTQAFQMCYRLFQASLLGEDQWARIRNPVARSQNRPDLAGDWIVDIARNMGLLDE